MTNWQAQGTAEPSFLATQLEAVAGKALGKEDIEDLKGSAGIIFGAGAETVRNLRILLATNIQVPALDVV